MKRFLLISLILSLPQLIYSQDFERPGIFTYPAQPAYMPIRYSIFSSKTDSLILDYIQRDKTKEYFVEWVETNRYIDLRVFGFTKSEISDSPGFSEYVASTYRYIQVGDLKLPVLLFLDKEFSGINWEPVEVLDIRMKFDREIAFESSSIHKYENRTPYD